MGDERVYALRPGWPTVEEVSQCPSPTQIVRWNRLLPSATTQAELDVISAIIGRLRTLPDNERVRASRAVGW